VSKDHLFLCFKW